MSFYQILNSIWRRERADGKLIRLENDFFEKARAYLNHLENQAKTEQDELIAELFKRRWTRATYLVNDLITLRIEKHIRETLDGQTHDKEMPHEEKEFRTRLEQLTAKFRETVLGIQSEEETDEQVYFDEQQYHLIEMTKAESITSIGSDLLTYGPFKEDDLVYLPAENAAILIKKSKAKRIDID